MNESQVMGWVILGLFLWCLCARSRWYQLIPTQLMQQNLVFGCAFALLPLWLLQTGIKPGLEVHFLGLTTATLLLGWRFSLFAGLMTLTIITAIQSTPWAEFGWQAFVQVIVPICVSYSIFLLTYNFLPRHLFIYIFVAAFFNGAITLLCALLAESWISAMRGLYPWEVIVESYLHIWPLLVFPEALLNGMAVTLFAVYRPAWLMTYKEKDYISF